MYLTTSCALHVSIIYLTLGWCHLQSVTSICGVFMRHKTSCYKQQYSKSINSQTDHRTRSMFTQRYICSGLKTQILTVPFAILIITYWFAISFKETTKLLFYDLSRLPLYRILMSSKILLFLCLEFTGLNNRSRKSTKY